MNTKCQRKKDAWTLDKKSERKYRVNKVYYLKQNVP